MRAFLDAAPTLQPGARAPLAAHSPAACARMVAGVRPGLDDESFLEYLAAAKARGNMQR